MDECKCRLISLISAEKRLEIARDELKAAVEACKRLEDDGIGTGDIETDDTNLLRMSLISIEGIRNKIALKINEADLEWREGMIPYADVVDEEEEE